MLHEVYGRVLGSPLQAWTPYKKCFYYKLAMLLCILGCLYSCTKDYCA